MKKAVLLLLTTTFLFLNSCKKEKDYTGVWENTGHYGKLTIKIDKEENGYFLTQTHTPLRKHDHEHNHEHEHEHEKKENKIKVNIQNDSLFFTIKEEPQTASFSEDEKTLKAFGRIYTQKNQK